MAETPDEVARMIVEAITSSMRDSARSAQSRAGLIGASDLSCRNRLRYMIQQAPQAPRTDIPWAAFVGTAIGAMLEAELKARNPAVRTQEAVLTTLPSGRAIKGHPDWYVPAEGDFPGLVVDNKTKNGLGLAKREEVSRQFKYQVGMYHEGLVQKGLIRPDAKAYIAYLDRSGNDPEPVVKQVDVTPELITEIDEWIGDAEYAVAYGEEAPRDVFYDQCKVICPYFDLCRGKETHAAGGLIEDEDTLTTIKTYLDARADEKAAKALAEEARDALTGVAGTTPDGFVVSQTVINASTYEVNRPAGVRLTIRKLKK